MAKEEELYQGSNKYKFTNTVTKIEPLHDHIIVKGMDFSGRKLASGILLLNDDGKTDGIRPRWAQVFAVGPDQKEIKVGQWIMLEHGRWTRGFNVKIDDEELVLRRADPSSIIFVSDTEPSESTKNAISTAVHAEAKTRTNWAEE